MSDDRFDKLENKIDKLDDRLNEYNTTNALNTQSLIEHIKRTNQLEERISPLEQRMLLVNTIVKICVAITGVAGFALVVLELLGKR